MGELRLLEQIDLLELIDEYAFCLAFTVDGDYLYISDGRLAVYKIDLKTKTKIASIEEEDTINQVAVHGDYVYYSTHGVECLKQCRRDNLQYVKGYQLDPPYYRRGFFAIDGNYLYLWNTDWARGAPLKIAKLSLPDLTKIKDTTISGSPNKLFRLGQLLGDHLYFIDDYNNVLYKVSKETLEVEATKQFNVRLTEGITLIKDHLYLNYVADNPWRAGFIKLDKNTLNILETWETTNYSWFEQSQPLNSLCLTVAWEPEGYYTYLACLDLDTKTIKASYFFNETTYFTPTFVINDAIYTIVYDLENDITPYLLKLSYIPPPIEEVSEGTIAEVLNGVLTSIEGVTRGVSDAIAYNSTVIGTTALLATLTPLTAKSLNPVLKLIKGLR